MADRTQRIRDPIHGLIIFDKDSPTDMLAWRLIQTSEFQRLRRIKQLGVSELVFPGATHSRLAHSIGVYHNARRLMDVIEREEEDAFDPKRASVVLIAALLHDLGHGPFSHAFEGARKALAKSRGKSGIDKHEKYTAELIESPDGDIRRILDAIDSSLATEVAELIRADDPKDVYHAVVSSSFDADRLDYLMRDRYMTGTQAGTIDSDWLIDNLAIDHIPARQDEDGETAALGSLPTFVFKLKGRQAAEDFLLARYRLYTQVYLHKATRGFEQAVSALIVRIGELSEEPERLGLDREHPLVGFLRPDGETLALYRDLDDTVVWGAVERLRRCGDAHARDLAERLWNRKPLPVLDITAQIGPEAADRVPAIHRIDQYAGARSGKTIFKDEATYNLYTLAKGEGPKEHKKVRIRASNGCPKEIVAFPDSVISKNLMNKETLTRYFFLSEEEKSSAERAMRGR